MPSGRSVSDRPPRSANVYISLRHDVGRLAHAADEQAGVLEHRRLDVARSRRAAAVAASASRTASHRRGRGRNDVVGALGRLETHRASPSTALRCGAGARQPWRTGSSAFPADGRAGLRGRAGPRSGRRAAAPCRRGSPASSVVAARQVGASDRTRRRAGRPRTSARAASPAGAATRAPGALADGAPGVSGVRNVTDPSVWPGVWSTVNVEAGHVEGRRRRSARARSRTARRTSRRSRGAPPPTPAAARRAGRRASPGRRDAPSRRAS